MSSVLFGLRGKTHGEFGRRNCVAGLGCVVDVFGVGSGLGDREANLTIRSL